MKQPNHTPPRFDDLPDLCTPEEVQQFLRISRNACYEMLRRGDIPSVKFGRLIRVPKTALAGAV